MPFIVSSGPYGGILPPLVVSGKKYLPYGYATGNASITIAANLAYIVPFPVFQTTTFSGSVFKNSGAGDNGKKVRTAIYAQGSSGSHGALMKDFGEVVLGAASAEHLTANTITLAAGMYFIEMVSDTTPGIQSMGIGIQASSVGMKFANERATLLGTFSIDYAGFDPNNDGSVADTVALAYGAFPSNGTIPTATIINDTSGAKVPLIGLYV